GVCRVLCRDARSACSGVFRLERAGRDGGELRRAAARRDGLLPDREPGPAAAPASPPSAVGTPPVLVFRAARPGRTCGGRGIWSQRLSCSAVWWLRPPRSVTSPS